MTDPTASAPKDGSRAFWANLLMAHLWAATTYIKPGPYPVGAGLLTLFIAGLMVYEDRITAMLKERTNGNA